MVASSNVATMFFKKGGNWFEEKQSYDHHIPGTGGNYVSSGIYVSDLQNHCNELFQD